MCPKEHLLMVTKDLWTKPILVGEAYLNLFFTPPCHCGDPHWHFWTSELSHSLLANGSEGLTLILELPLPKLTTLCNWKLYTASTSPAPSTISAAWPRVRPKWGFRLPGHFLLLDRPAQSSLITANHVILHGWNSRYDSPLPSGNIIVSVWT